VTTTFSRLFTALRGVASSDPSRAKPLVFMHRLQKIVSMKYCRPAPPLVTIAFFLIFLSWLGECKKPDRPVEKAPVGPSVVFLGDSLSAGLGLPDELTYPSIVENKIKESGMKYRVINAGRSGDTTAGGLSRLSWYLRDDVELKVLIIELGSNDAMRGQPPASVEKNLTEIIRKTKKYNPAIKILLFQFYTFPNLGKAYGAEFAAIYPRVAKKENIVLLPFPLKGVAGIPELNQEDGIHPNEKGEAIVGANVWKSIQPYL